MLGWLGLGGAGLVAGGALAGCNRGWSSPDGDPTSRSLVKPHVPGAEGFATFEERWIQSSCGQCPAACGVRVRVVEGRAVRIEGNPHNPLNRGGIGARGQAGLQALYDADRLRGPMRRDGARLVPVSWEQALSSLAASLGELRARAPEELLVLSGQDRGTVHELLARFATAFGSPNFVDGQAAHGGALAQAMEASLGVRELPAYGWGRAASILTLEAALLEDSCRSIYFARLASTLRRDVKRRARLLHAGPAFDLAAYNSDRWLRLAPGTSGALALGLCHVLLRDGTYDTEAYAAAKGTVEFGALVADFAPDRVATITGIPADEVVRLAHELWAHRPAIVVIDERSLAFSNGVDTARAALALNALLGSIENPEGGLRLAPTPPLRAWSEPELDDAARRGLATPRPAALDALADEIDAHPPAAALLYHANPAYARPQPRRWRDALARVPLVVSFSPYLDETVDSVAHLVLPDHTYLERHEDAIPAPGLARSVVGVRVPAVTPLYDTRATGDVLVDLARRLGGSVARSFPWTSARDAIEERLLGLHDARRGTITARTHRGGFLDAIYAAGFWAEADEAPAGAVTFAFPSTWSPPSWDGDPIDYPLALLAYRPLGYAEGSGANQPWLRMLSPRPGIGEWSFAASVSPVDLPAGMKEGERIRVESPHGAVELPVHVDKRLAPGTVAIPTGGGHQALGRWARAFGVNVMDLLRLAPAPSGASMLCSTRVRITRRGEPAHHRRRTS
jgi:anaerobic selenocysteine-containing dehydrogenase